MKIILYNLTSFLNWICNLTFVILFMFICIAYIAYWIKLSEIKDIYYIILTMSIVWIIFIPPEEKLKQYFLSNNDEQKM